MALDKVPVPINFAKGLDKKTDKFQVQLGNFLELENTVFETGTLLQKRNGFGNLPTISGTNVSTDLATYLGNLIAIGDTLQVLNSDSGQWLNRGAIQPISLDVIPLVRTSGSQTTVDTAVASNGLACSVFLDGSANYYQISDSVTGQIIVNRTALPSLTAMARAFVLGNFFIIVFLRTLAGTRIQYIAIPLNNPLTPGAPVNLSSQVSNIAAGWDGFVANNTLYMAWDASDLGGAIRVTSLGSTLNQANVVAVAGEKAELMSVTADTTGTTPVIWVSYWDSTSNDLSAFALNSSLIQSLAPTVLASGLTLRVLTSVAEDQILTAVYDNVNTYTFSAVETDFLSSVTCTESGTVGTPSNIIRSVGLASKAVIFNNKVYFLTSYNGTYQPSYFLVDLDGTIIAKLAYSNGSGYAINQILPQINLNGSKLSIGYLIRDLLATVNKSQGNPNPNGIYTQTGINLVAYSIPGTGSIDAELAQSLHLTGGYVTQYDGAKPVEHGFHVWPEDIDVTASPTGGSVTDGPKFYAITYEWTDAKGLLHRSAPSVPFGINNTGGNTSSNTLNIPTLRLTSKTGDNPVRIVIYRWSQAQQVYYQVTSISSPLLNNTTVDSVQYVDTQSDSDILGNVILYTTGGVLENIAAPACSTSTMFDSRLWVIDAEDKNLAWYSKPVIQGTPVEFSDFQTIYVTPVTAAQGNTGGITADAVLDDKIIFFKRNAISYVAGRGPDITGANNQYSEPTYVLGTVGCTNQRSIVTIPQGLMFQSDKGIWLLDRTLNTTYIGAPVESFNADTVLSAINVPGTNQVRFTLDSGVTLMYDYYYGQWGTFTGIPAVSSTLYQNLHTYLNEFGVVRQETPGKYLDGTKPVLLKFTTSWLNLAGIQGLERMYFMYMLASYISPHTLTIQVAYDYNNSPSQTTTIVPDNYALPYGVSTLYGGGSETYGGPGPIEQWRVFFSTQKCQSLRLTLSENYDPSLGESAGAGLTISQLNFLVGIKKGAPTLKASRSVG